MAEFRNPHNLPVKTCVVCNRPFTWRKKWERCWDEVTTCSKSCNAARKREKRADGAEDDVDVDQSDKGGSASDGEERGGGAEEGPDGARDARREQRKAAKKAAKAEKRAKRGDGEGAGDDGTKPCDGCGKRADLLIRCQTDASRKWTMQCGKCCKVASGRVPDGDANHPHNRYGGLWKNRRASRHVSTAVPELEALESLRVN